MSIKYFLVYLAILIPYFVSGQSQFDDYSLDQLITTAQYGEGERQSNAQNELAIRYKNGIKGAEQDFQKAFYWFQRSSNMGNKYAMYNLANLYLNGSGINRDVSKAVFWMEESAKHYFPSASLLIGQWYYNGTYVSQDYSKASQYLKDAAFSGEEEAMFYYAECFAKGKGVKADLHQAVFWANRAIDNNYYDGYYLLGTIYIDGLIVEVNNSLAKQYLLKGIEHDNTKCLTQMGILLTNNPNTITDESIKEAKEYFMRAANLGEIGSMICLGALYASDLYGINDYKAASYWFQKVFDLGYENAVLDNLLYCYEMQQDFERALHICTKKANENNANVLYRLSYYYAEGKGVEKNLNTAVYYIDKAISIAPNNQSYLNYKSSLLQELVK